MTTPKVAGSSDPRAFSTALKRLYDAFSFALRENEYLRWLDDLDRWNTRLSSLRAQLCKLQKRRNNYRVDCLIRKSVPKRYTDIRTASQKLHDSLRDSWSCTNVSHVGHQAKLSLDAQAEYGTAQLDIVIACRRKTTIGVPSEKHQTHSESPIWLQVRSITAEKACTKTSFQTPALLGSLSTSLHNATPTSAPPSIAPSTVSIIQKSKKVLKRVRFDATSNSDSPPNSPPRKTVSLPTTTQATAVTYTTLDLNTKPSICCHLSNACRSTSCSADSLGYLESLESPESFKFIFYDAGRNAEANVARNLAGKDSHSIQPELANLQTLQQLTLAYKLATAVLQYHSTSWLSADWGLEDIAYFNHNTLNKTNQSRAEDKITTALQTLHLSTQFPEETLMSQTGPVSDLEQLKYMYGIRNLTLAKLGVALLEIGSKKELTVIDPSPSHCIISARKVLHEKPPLLTTLGNRYNKIVQQCIDCDFSCGEDLEEEALRSAVYTDVVCALEDMIIGWKNVMGIK